jgi:hypothetical protein
MPHRGCKCYFEQIALFLLDRSYRARILGFSLELAEK